ncbi:N-acyl-L-homoserine lactone synthetase [Alkalibacterium subtropicum]|uniref:N-acyl-L-homoserine lactone synthetase n=1 Tax=Alkalibacterium subtropicum TaxID=753702 RepID=A0A1I1HJM5_9LACT|nr:acyl-homoserine-lactone synthase [Alkalibacterium subtropicum]SFC24041.1 N-acyl-L-homoserine lactone synthetase [Alkalibacterium subtropicum]
MESEKEYHFGRVEGNKSTEAIALHHQRYQEVGFLKKDDEDPYIDHSTYFVVETADAKEVVGVTRLIFMSLDDLPTMKHFNIFEIEKLKLAGLEDNKYAEISAFTKMPKHDVGLGLIRTVLNYSLSNGLTHWVCCIDERVYRYMHRIFKFPFEVIGEPNVYLGSKTIPCVLNLSECLTTLKEKRRTLYDYLVESEEKVMEGIK